MARVVDDVIAGLQSEFKDIVSRRKIATDEIVQRDVATYKDIISLLEAIQGYIADICQEHVKLTIRPVVVNTEHKTSSCHFALEQGEVNYVLFGPIIFEVKLNGDALTINDKRFGPEAYRDGFTFIAEEAFKAMENPIARADFGLPNDPIGIMARRR